MNDLSVFEDTLIKWIKKTDRNAELILELTNEINADF